MIDKEEVTIHKAFHSDKNGTHFSVPPNPIAQLYEIVISIFTMLSLIFNCSVNVIMSSEYEGVHLVLLS